MLEWLKPLLKAESGSSRDCRCLSTNSVDVKGRQDRLLLTTFESLETGCSPYLVLAQIALDDCEVALGAGSEE